MKHILVISAIIGISIVTDVQTFYRPDGLMSSFQPVDRSEYFPTYLQLNGYQHRFIDGPYEVVTPEEAGYTQEELNEIYYGQDYSNP